MRRAQPAASGGAGDGAAVILGCWTRQKPPGWVGRRLRLGQSRRGVGPGTEPEADRPGSPPGRASRRGPCGARAVAEVASASRGLTCAGRGAPGAEACAPLGASPGRQRGGGGAAARASRGSPGSLSLTGPPGPAVRDAAACSRAARCRGRASLFTCRWSPGPPKVKVAGPQDWSPRRRAPDSDLLLPRSLRRHLDWIRPWCFLRRGVWYRERNPGDFWDPLFFFFCALRA